MSQIIPVLERPASSSLRTLFDENQPVAIRCFAVLDGSIRGEIWTDDPDNPTWAAVQEAAFNTLFLGGHPSAAQVGDLIDLLRADREVALALWPDHPTNGLLPPAPDFDGWELDFTDRPSSDDPARGLSVPEGCELLPIDAAWFERCRYRDYYAAYFESAEEALNNGLGFCLVRGQELLAEAFAGDAALGMIEIGAITGEPYRRLGYARLVCSRTIQECEARGYRTYWNCSKENEASAGLARSLGYRSEKEFRFVVFDAISGSAQ